VESDITVCIPTIPVRRPLLQRAVASVLAQTLPASGLSVAVDLRKEGAAVTRQRALECAWTGGRRRAGWVAFLDDDDEFLPQHLERLWRHARDEDADYVYSWFETVPTGGDPFPPHHFTDDWNPLDPIQTTITILVRLELALDVGFLTWDDDGRTVAGQRHGEDYEFTLGCVRAGAKISHLAERTWLWHHDSGNTSGRPDRW
jgi:glycosyltransferase involved in cell wall biosynthesis